MKEHLIIKEVRKIRSRMPKIGGVKLYKLLKGFLKSHDIKIGRDRFFDVLRTHKLLVKRRKKYAKTTDSGHGFRTWRNKIKELELTRPDQVFVADITYISTLEGFCYLALITDAYSRKIVGYDLSQSLSIEGSLRALEMALKGVKHPEKLIHHSDRGVQYCSHAYVDKLKANDVTISMTELDHVYENALAERVNGILKTEFMLDETLSSFRVAKELVKETIQIYNEERPHMNIDYLTPQMKHAA